MNRSRAAGGRIRSRESAPGLCRTIVVNDGWDSNVEDEIGFGTTARVAAATPLCSAARGQGLVRVDAAWRLLSNAKLLKSGILYVLEMHH